jgi:cell division protein FtsZ
MQRGESLIEKDKPPMKSAKIKIIGVGGSGIAILNYIIGEKLSNIDHIAIDTANEGLITSKAPFQLIISENGLESGGNSEIGKSAATKNIDYIQNMLTGADRLFITGGLGGGTATGTLPVVAEVAQHLNIQTHAVITLPFSLEGAERQRIAQRGAQSLQKNVGELTLIYNDSLLHFAPTNPALQQLFSLSDRAVGWKILAKLI